ncbi:ABC transporter ATP-binding protein [Candidatus Albibeggiatoa sp. nov. NOAA]|uniref:ABC transporter ATP-binding protein n=1 Tax=Candidatus Albibeggiatoa sp. nov. NOAA TaxID=3162724 RepID=UPI0032FAFE75|nr:ABC transporter ATP-binding protein [Thiotrichaceae bacterium]
MNNSQLQVNQIEVGYAQHTIISELSFSLTQGDIACLLGPSGCGKSTLLRAIAGFEPVRNGEIVLHGRQVSSSKTTVQPEKRKVGMVFQDFALFPHLTVARNVTFGLRGFSVAEQQQRVDHLLELVGLADFKHAYPHQLSGGQQQRVALIRAIAPRPELLLLDEPFSSMDIELREQLAFEVRALLKQDGITAIMVTHDQMEAFAFADWVGVMQQGQLLQWGSAYELYHQPVNHFVAEFIGQGVLLAGKVQDSHQIMTDLGMLKNGKLPSHITIGDDIHVLLRPDDVIYDGNSPVKGKIIEKRFRGAEYLYTLQLQNGSEVFCLVPSHHHNHALHEEIGVQLDIEHLVVLSMEK